MAHVGCVPYLNAKPLVLALGEVGVTTQFAVPSQLPALLDSGDCAAIMVSSIYALSTPGCRYAEGLGISSQHDVQSVRLFSQVPFDQIRSLRLDPSSMTSNILAQIVLRETYHSSPEIKPDGAAEVVIGDAGLTHPGAPYILDLGSAWRELTGLPFVWALWVGHDALAIELSEKLNQARDKGVQRITEIAKAAPIPAADAEHYLTHCIDFGWSEAHEQAVHLFGNKALAHGLISELYQPVPVPGSHVTA